MKKSFLLLSGLFLLAACSGNGISSGANSDSGTTPAEQEEAFVSTWTTTGDKSMLFAFRKLPLGKKASMSPNLVKIDKSTRYQSVDGFGAAMTWASCYNLQKMSAADRHDLLKELFDPTDGLGISLVRVSIGASDFNLNEYTWCDEEGIENFAVNESDRKVVFPILREMFEINPDVKIIASPWSAPIWMKSYWNGDRSYNSWTGGIVCPDLYQEFAQYMVKWVQTMEEEGFPIMAVTLQNEPLHEGNSMSTFMPWALQRDIIKQAVGPAFADAGLSTKILVYDHNYGFSDMEDQKNYPIRIYEDPEASAYVAGSAWHNYTGSVSVLKEIHELAPEKEIYFTEASIGSWYYDFDVCLIKDFKDIFMRTLENYNKGVTLWNMVLDDHNGPYSPQPGSCKTCYGVVEVSKSTHKVVERRTHYYNIAHASKVIRPGAERLATSGYSADNLMYQAYENTDGSIGIIVLNEAGEERQLVFTTNTHSATVKVPGRSIFSILFPDK